MFHWIPGQQLHNSIRSPQSTITILNVETILRNLISCFLTTCLSYQLSTHNILLFLCNKTPEELSACLWQSLAIDDLLQFF